MGEEDARDPSEDLAAWLKDSGHRRWGPQQPVPGKPPEVPAESPEMLVECLEQLAGRKFRSKDEVRSYVAEISGQAGSPPENARTRQLVRHTLLLLGLLTAYMQYNFIDVSLQIARLPATIIFVPVMQAGASQRSEEPARTS